MTTTQQTKRYDVTVYFTDPDIDTNLAISYVREALSSHVLVEDIYSVKQDGRAPIVSLTTHHVDHNDLWHQWVLPVCGVKNRTNLARVEVDRRPIKASYYKKGW